MQQDIRDKVIQFIDRTVQRRRLLNIDKAYAFVNSSWYHQLIRDKNFDVLLECYISSLGISFSLICEDLHEWKKLTSKNNREWNWRVWNTSIQERWTDVPEYPRPVMKDRVKGYIRDMNEGDVDGE